MHVPEREIEREREGGVIDEESDTAHRCLCVLDREGREFYPSTKGSTNVISQGVLA